MTRVVPSVLTIAGSDSGAAAGAQMDLKTFAALGLHGGTVITGLTAQNTKRILALKSAGARMVRLQLEAVFEAFAPRAVKTGMLYSASIVHTLADFWRRGPKSKLVIDPVMVSTSGTRLLSDAGRRALFDELAPMADLITPNLPEAEAILDTSIGVNEGQKAAREIHLRLGCGVLLKGGHFPKGPRSVDYYCDGGREFALSAPRARVRAAPGTGCAYSAAIAAYLAMGEDLPKAVERAKRFITGAIENRVRIKGGVLLNPFWARTPT